MKRLLGTILICGFLTALGADAAKPVSHPKPGQKAARKMIGKAQKKNARARKAAVRKAKARRAVK